LGACVFFSCQDDHADLPVETVVDYTFQVFVRQQGNIDELSTRAADPTYSLLVVDVQGDTCAQQLSRLQLPASDALAQVQLPLRQGAHRICFLCSAKPWDSFDADQLWVHWSEPSYPLGDVWATVVDVEVEGTAAQQQEVRLNRAVAYVRTTLQDALPQNLARFRQVLVGGSWTYSLLSQTGGLPTQIVHDFSLRPQHLGLTGQSIGLYTFVPEGKSTATSYTLQAFDAHQQMFQSVTFDDVPLVVNQYTNYQGNFFSASSHYRLSLQDDWLEPNNIHF
jgi:hypothetical protein